MGRVAQSRRCYIVVATSNEPLSQSSSPSVPRSTPDSSGKSIRNPTKIGPKINQNRPKIDPGSAPGRLGGARSPPRALKSGPGGAQGAPRSPPGATREPPEGPQGRPGGPKRSPGSPRRHPEGTKIDPKASPNPFGGQLCSASSFQAVFGTFFDRFCCQK